MKRTLFVGSQPVSYEAEQKPEMEFQSGGAMDLLIRNYMDTSAEVFHRNFDFMYVSAHHEPEGLSPEYHQTDMRNLRSLISGRRVVMLGAAVAWAFEIQRHEYEWCQFIDHPKWETHHGLFCTIPHPRAARVWLNSSIVEMTRNTMSMLYQIAQEEKHQ